MTLDTLKYSIIIPARNEELNLPKCLAALHRALQNSNQVAEFIVVNNRSEDRTPIVAKELGCRVIEDQSKNLSIIRNHGARESTGEILIFVDADSLVSPNLFTEIRHALTDPRTHGGGVMIFPERWSLGIALSMMAIFPIALWYRISAGLFYTKRDSFDAIGGFDETRYSAEDIDFAHRLRVYAKSRGGKFKTLFRAWIITSCRKFDRFGDWYFFRHPIAMLRLLKGKDVKFANKIWYDF